MPSLPRRDNRRNREVEHRVAGALRPKQERLLSGAPLRIRIALAGRFAQVDFRAT